jgi:tetratricopeptide (TPR) repeat protein
MTPAVLVLLAADATLGDVKFPVTARQPATQTCFHRGVAALHSFWFEEAREQFQACTGAEPGFAMGYWGEAMTWNHSLWNRVWLNEGRQAIQKAKKDGLTDREKGYIAAVELLFGEGTKRERERAYSKAMASLHAAFPDDLEAAAFYSLSLIALGEPLADRMKAGAIAQDVYAKNPNHPGAAHYIIHAFDDPDHAILALPAARRYAEIAPESHHAKHMPSHIFLQLGMWPETVRSNEEGWAASVAWQQRKKLPMELRDYHSQYWLAYGYLQQGRSAEAWKIYDAKRADIVAAQGAGGVYRYWTSLAAMLIAETGAWDRAKTAFDDPVTIRKTGGGHAHSPEGPDRAVAAFVKGWAALETGGRADSFIDEVEQVRLIAVQTKRKALEHQASALREALQGLASFKAGETDAALAALARATEFEEKGPAPSGPPDLIKPTHELYGEVLLAAGRPAQAAVQFEKSLRRQPDRAKSVAGLRSARAAMTNSSQ